MTSNGHAHVHLPWTHPHHPPSEKRLLDGVDLASPLHSGYMFKEAHSHLVFHKRFFVLFPRVLVYYEKESYYKKDVARGTLEVRNPLGYASLPTLYYIAQSAAGPPNLYAKPRCSTSMATTTWYPLAVVDKCMWNGLLH